MRLTMASRQTFVMAEKPASDCRRLFDSESDAVLSPSLDLESKMPADYRSARNLQTLQSAGRLWL